jgi:hypothetical protein
MSKNVEPKPTEEQIRECMLHLENLITVMQTKFSEDDIMKFVHLVLQGHITQGAFTPEYIKHAAAAQDMRKNWRAEELNPAQKIIVNGFNPRPKKI